MAIHTICGIKILINDLNAVMCDDKFDAFCGNLCNANLTLCGCQALVIC